MIKVNVMFEIEGKVINVLPMLSGTGANGEWKRQVIVIEYMDGSYTNNVALENSKNADAFSQLSVGTEGKFSCKATSREYNGRWFTSVTCFKWDCKPLSEQPPV